MGMNNLQTECLFCNSGSIVNNNNSSIDAYEFYCENCTGKYYLILSKQEMELLKNIVFYYKEKLLEIFNEDMIRPENGNKTFDCHWPLTFKDIKQELKINS